MFIANLRTVAEIIARLGPIVVHASQLINKWRKKDLAADLREIPAPENLPARIERLEKDLEFQSKLNEEFVSEMQVLKPALEGIQRSIRFLSILAFLACGLSLAAIILLLSR